MQILQRHQQKASFGDLGFDTQSCKTEEISITSSVKINPVVPYEGNREKKIPNSVDFV